MFRFLNELIIKLNAIKRMRAHWDAIQSVFANKVCESTYYAATISINVQIGQCKIVVYRKVEQILGIFWRAYMALITAEIIWHLVYRICGRLPLRTNFGIPLLMINTKIICDQIQNRIGAKLKVTFNVIKSPDKLNLELTTTLWILH